MQKKLKKLISLLLVTVMAFSMTACGGGDSNTSSTGSDQPSSGTSAGSSSGASATDSKKDTLVYAWLNDGTTMHPQIQNGQNEISVYQVYSGLTKFDEETNEIVGDLADSWTVSDDQLTWTFNLKKGVKWHNGDDFTAEDVKATFEGPMDPNTNLKMAYQYFQVFSKIEVVDDYTVKITTFEPYGPMLAFLANRTTAICNKSYIEKYPEDKLGDSVESTCGTGPYKFVEWKKGDEMRFERFEDYFGEKAPIKNLIFKQIPDAAAQVVALQNGEADFISKVSSEDMIILADDPNVQLNEVKSNGQMQFRFCMNDETMQNLKVRQAISYALDRDAIVAGLFKGLGEVSTCAVAPLTFGYNDLGPIKRDLEKARTLMAEAGYPDGFKTKVVTTPRYTKGVEMAEAMAQQLKEIGIELEVEVVEWTAFTEIIGGKGPDDLDAPLLIMGCGPSMMDADGGLRGLYTTTVTGTNERNYSLYSNPDVDRLLEEGMRETDPDKRLEIYRQAEQILYYDDPAAVWIYDMYRINGANAKLDNMLSLGTGLPLFYKFSYRE